MTLTVTEDPNFPFHFYFILFMLFTLILKYLGAKLKPCLHSVKGQGFDCVGRYTPWNYSSKLAADILSGYYIQDTALRSRHTAVHKRSKAPVFMVFQYYNILAP